MNDSLSQLHIFSISHFCEKGRWGMDYFEIPHRVNILTPGPHIAFARSLGLRYGSLPILETANEVVQGSSAIIEWAEKHACNDATLMTVGPAEIEMEQRLDSRIGVHVRRMFYSEALVEHPQMVKPVFSTGLSILEKIRLSLSWRLVRQNMIERMDLGEEQGRESQKIIEGELDWLDGLLSDGRPYLLGDEFSRLDITAAGLLARIALPPEYPSDDGFSHPPRVAEVAAIWKKRPIMQWVLRMYALHRG